MRWNELRFGKYKGRTIPAVLFTDPGWFFFVHEREAFRRYGMAGEADAAAGRATNIRIPDEYGDDFRVQYSLDPLNGKFGGVELVRAAYVSDGGASGTIVSLVFDLSLPYRLAGYDKAGGQLLLKTLKPILFAGPRATRDRIERFFGDDRNFRLAG